MAEAYDGGPIAALRRIGFLLERGREETYKVRAYRNAAAAILPLGEDEVRARGPRLLETVGGCRSRVNVTGTLPVDNPVDNRVHKWPGPWRHAARPGTSLWITTASETPKRV